MIVGPNKCCKSFMTLPVLCSIFGSRNLTKCGADFSQSSDVLLSLARLNAAASLRFSSQSAGTEFSAEQSVVTDQQFKDLPDKSPESNPERRFGIWGGAEGKTPEETSVLFHATLAAATAL